MERSANSWGPGAKLAEALGEGNPQAWREIGLAPIPHDWRTICHPADSLLVGLYQSEPTPPSQICRIAGGACIHRSQGDVRKLPLSFLWEVLSIATIGKLLDCLAVVLLPIAEESTRQPELGEAYTQLGRSVQGMCQTLSSMLHQPIQAHWTPHTWSLDDVPTSSLYGLFHPFATCANLRVFPFGDPDEAVFLKAYASYCARYRQLDGGLRSSDLIVEGIHIAKSILLGVSERASYLATVPLPSPQGMRLAVDEDHVALITEPMECPDSWWPNQMLQSVFNLNLESIRSSLMSDFSRL